MFNKKFFLFSLLLLISGSRLFAQAPGNWYSYYDAKKELYGFVDAKGKIKIPARFNGLTRARVFKNIIAVTNAATSQSYYLLKSGKQSGKDSLYVWDMSYDCEQEGKIRFRDAKTDKVGFFATDGKVTIPAVYNDAQPFYNGLAVVIYNGKRVCADGSAVDAKNPCEHWSWAGVTALIDENGTIVADSLDIDQLSGINWYSLQTSAKPADTTIRISFKTKNAGYYTFINYKKEFSQWFHKEYLNTAHQASLSALFNLVCVEGLFKNKLRRFYSNKAFKAIYYSSLLKKLNRIKTGKMETQITSEQLNTMIFDQAAFKSYYTDCGDANEAKYPLFDVVTSTYGKNRKFLYQEHFSFLRTAGGYKLIEVAWKKL